MIYLRRLIVRAIERTCWVLDALPAKRGSHWYWNGGWGCRHGVARVAFDLDDRWSTEVGPDYADRRIWK